MMPSTFVPRGGRTLGIAPPPVPRAIDSYELVPRQVNTGWTGGQVREPLPQSVRLSVSDSVNTYPPGYTSAQLTEYQSR
jgi:hypothetical protein